MIQQALIDRIEKQLKAKRKITFLVGAGLSAESGIPTFRDVDGLHFQSGMNEKQLYLIHGDLRFMRCSEACTNELYPIPDKLINRGKKEFLSVAETELINCPKCEDICRPHVLWFDEYYNEQYYKLNSVQRIAKETGILFIVGTSGATTLPKRIVDLALSNSSLVIDINPRSNLLTDKITQSKNGFWLQGKSGKIIPFLAEYLKSIKFKES